MHWGHIGLAGCLGFVGAGDQGHFDGSGNCAVKNADGDFNHR